MARRNPVTGEQGSENARKPRLRFAVALAMLHTIAFTVATLLGAMSVVMLLIALSFIQAAFLDEHPMKTFRRQFGDRAFLINCALLALGIFVTALRRAYETWNQGPVIDPSTVVFVVLYALTGIAATVLIYFLVRKLKPLDAAKSPFTDTVDPGGLER